MALTPASAQAALQSAAGGQKGTGGFSQLTKYVEKISSDLIPVGGALAVLGLIYGGSLLMAGAPHAGRTLTYVVVGVVVILASNGLAK
jgi:type IV secretory pathway VirB2 component (pilin)